MGKFNLNWGNTFKEFARIAQEMEADMQQKQRSQMVYTNLTQELF